MITLKSFDIKGFRGVWDLHHEFRDDESLLLYGLNGTGKTSINLALRFGLTGELHPLSAAQSPPEVYRHKRLQPGSEASVRITFTESGDDHTIQRTISDDGKVGIRVSSARARELLDEGSYALCFLTRSEFAAMVDSVEKDRWRRLTPFLGHERLSNVREGLRSLSNSIKRDLRLTEKETAVSNLKQAVKRIDSEMKVELEMVGRSSFDIDVAREMLSTSTNGVSVTEYHSFDDLPWTEYEALLPEGGQAKELAARVRSVSAQIATTKQYSALKFENLQLATSFLKKINRDHSLAHDILHAEFYKAAREAIDAYTAESCPICGATVSDWESVRSDLDVKTSSMDKIRSTLTNSKGIIQSHIATVKSLLEGTTELVANDHTDELSQIENVGKRALELLKVALTRVTDLPLKGLTDLESETLHAACSELSKDMGQAYQSLESQSQRLEDEMQRVTTSQAHVTYLTVKSLASKAQRRDELMKELNSASRELAETNTVIGNVQNFYAEFSSAEQELSDRALTQLDTEVGRIFGLLTDQANLVPQIEPRTERGIRTVDIAIKDFYGLGEVPAREYLSEAFRNSLGLSIYFAGFKLRSPTLHTLIMDDITHSADNIHRRGLAEFIARELCGSMQLILLTHDKHWYSRLEQSLDKEHWRRVQVINWSPDGMTYQDDKWVSLLDKAADRIQHFDHGGGNELRKALEQFMDEICEELKIEFPFKPSATSWSFNEKRQKLESAIQQAWKSKQGIIDPSTHALKLLLNSQRTANFASHYGSYDQWDHQDLIDVLKDVTDAVGLFLCKNSKNGKPCGRLLPSLTMSGGKMPICRSCKQPITL